MQNSNSSLLFTALSEFRTRNYINHFIQPDTVIPDLSNPQSWNRYSYVYNNSIRFTDPSGHACVDGTSYCVNSSTGQTSGSLTSYTDTYTGGDPDDELSSERSKASKGQDGPLYVPIHQNNCTTERNCTYASEQEIEDGIGIFKFLKKSLLVASVAYGAIGGMALPSPIGWIALLVAAEFAVESDSMGETISYLQDMKVAARNNNGEIKVYKEEALTSSSYTFEEAFDSESVGWVINRIMMEIWFTTSSWNDK